MSKIKTIIVLVFMSITTMHGQIDRSKQPTSGPVPKINIGKPQSFNLTNGLKVMVVENHKLPRVSISLHLDNPPIAEGSKAGVFELTGVMLGKGSISISKDVFNEEIDYMGAQLNLSSNGGYASGLSKYFDRLSQLMADAAINPNFTQDEFEKEKGKMIEGIKSEEKNIKATANRVKNLLAYGKNHPYGEFVSKESVTSVTLADVNTFYQNYFVPDNAYLVVTGDVKYDNVKEIVTEYFSNWRKGLAPSISIPSTKNVVFTQIAFVDMPDAVQSEISVMNTVDFKMTDKDYHAALIANKILGGGFNSMLNLNLREANGWTYGASSSLRADKDTQALFSTSTSVRNAVTDSAIVETLKEINNIRTLDVTKDQLASVKAKYLGDFVLAMEKPQTISRYALNIETYDLPADFYETFLDKINTVTIADVKRVANKYFKANNLRVIVIGKGSDVVTKLEEIMYNGKKIPVKYYDKYGSPTSKPVFSKPIPKNITSQFIIEKYLKVIGGKNILNSVKTLTYKGKINTKGQQLSLIIKKMHPNKELKEFLNAQAVVITKQVFDGNTGYVSQIGKKTPMRKGDIILAKTNTSIFKELNVDHSKITLISLTTIKGKEAYKLKIESNGAAEFRFYDTKSGYLLRTETTKKEEGKELIISTDYSNYTPTSGIQFPFSIITKDGSETFGMLINKVIVNEGVTGVDFK